MDYSVWTEMENTTISNLTLGFRQGILKNSEKLVVSLDYLKRDFDFFDREGLFPLNELEQSHQLQLDLAYRYDMGGSLSGILSFRPTIASTWTSSLSNEDFLWNFYAAISKTWSDGHSGRQQLGIGVLYDTLFGSPSVLPWVHYETRVFRRILLSLGFPYNSIGLQVNKRNQLILEHEFSGTYTNISSALQIEGLVDQLNTKLVQFGSQLALGYHFRLQPNFTTSTRIGYQFVDAFEIQDGADDQLYDFGQGSSLFFSMGIMYNFK